MSSFQDTIRRARRRTRLNLAIRNGGRGLVIGTCVALGVLLADRLLNWTLPPIAFITPPALGLLIGMLAAWSRRIDLLSAAVQLDRALHLRDQFGSAESLHLDKSDQRPQYDDAFASLVQRDADRLASKVDVRNAAPIRITGVWGTGVFAALALWLGVVLAPSLVVQADSTSEEAAAADPEVIRRERDDLASTIEESIEEIRGEATLDAQTLEDLEALKRLADQLAAGNADELEVDQARDESAARLSELADRMAEQSQRDLAAQQEVSRRFSGLRQPDAPPLTDEFTEALQRGEFDQAADLLDEMQANRDSYSASDREAMADRLRELGQQLDEAGSRDAREIEGRSETLEQALRDQGLDSQAIEEMMDDPPAADDLSRDLREKGVDEEIAEDLARDLERLDQRRDFDEQVREDTDRVSDALDEAADELERPGTDNDEQPPGPQSSPGDQTDSPDDSVEPPDQSEQPSPASEQSPPPGEEASETDPAKQSQSQSPPENQPDTPAQPAGETPPSSAEDQAAPQQQEQPEQSNPPDAESGDQAQGQEQQQQQQQQQGQEGDQQQGEARQDSEGTPANQPPSQDTPPDQQPQGQGQASGQEQVGTEQQPPEGTEAREVAQEGASRDEGQPQASPQGAQEREVPQEGTTPEEGQQQAAGDDEQHPSPDDQTAPTPDQGGDESQQEQPEGSDQQQQESSPQEEQSQPQEMPQLNEESMKRMGELIKRMPSGVLRELAERARDAEKNQQVSEQMREQARELLEELDDEQRQALEDVAQGQNPDGPRPQARNQDGSGPAPAPQPTPGTDPGAASGPNREGPASDAANARPVPMGFDETEDIDIRGTAEADKIIAEWLSEHALEGEAGRTDQPGRAQRIREVQEIAERAVDDSVVPPRYHNLIRRYFGNLGKTIGKASGENPPDASSAKTPDKTDSPPPAAKESSSDG